jgi:hypothetical protein
MTEWMMMAMMIGMANRNNAAETVQTVIGASNVLGEGGRMAVGLMRQQQIDAERALARKASDDRVRAIGRELHQLVHDIQEHHELGVSLEKYPKLTGAVRLALPDHAPIARPAPIAAPAPAPAPVAVVGGVNGRSAGHDGGPLFPLSPPNVTPPPAPPPAEAGADGHPAMHDG